MRCARVCADGFKLASVWITLNVACSSYEIDGDYRKVMSTTCKLLCKAYEADSKSYITHAFVYIIFFLCQTQYKCGKNKQASSNMWKKCIRRE